MRPSALSSSSRQCVNVSLSMNLSILLASRESIHQEARTGPYVYWDTVNTICKLEDSQVDGLCGNAFVTAQQQYVSRRRRCSNHLVEPDKKIALPESIVRCDVSSTFNNVSHRLDMLSNLAGPGRHEKTRIQASNGNSHDFQKFADALKLEHPRSHAHERSSSSDSNISSSSSMRQHGSEGSTCAGRGYHMEHMIDAYKGGMSQRHGHDVSRQDEEDFGPVSGSEAARAHTLDDEDHQR